MENFAAIDFETANEQRTSVCSVGVVIVRDGEFTDSFYSLIRPEPEYYSYWNTRVHGLTLADTTTGISGCVEGDCTTYRRAPACCP